MARKEVSDYVVFNMCISKRKRRRFVVGVTDMKIDYYKELREVIEKYGLKSKEADEVRDKLRKPLLKERDNRQTRFVVGVTDMKEISFANLENCTAQANSLIGNLVTCFLDFAYGLDANDEAADIVMELLDEHEIPYEMREVKMNNDDYCPICEHDFCICPEQVEIKITCRMCKKTYKIVVTTAQKNELDKPNGKHIQDILPTHTADERELLISQICGKCWDKMFDDGKNKLLEE